MGTQQFCLKWNNHQTNMLAVFEQLLSSEALVDVTLACDGLSLKAHKMVLSACSPFFQSLFLENPCKHPIVILKDMRYTDLKAIIDFMYRGEVNVSQDQLSALLKTAETLKVKGLAEVTGEQRQGASGVIQQEIVQQTVTTQALPLTSAQQHRAESPPLSRRKRGRPRRRSLSDSNRSDTEDQVPSKIKEPDSPEVVEDISRDGSDVSCEIRQRLSAPNHPQSQVSTHPIPHSSVLSSVSNQKPVTTVSSVQDSQVTVEEPPSGDETEFEMEPSKLMEQSMTTDNVPVFSDGPSQGPSLPPVSNQLAIPTTVGLVDTQPLHTTTGPCGDSQALIPCSLPSEPSTSSQLSQDTTQDIKPSALVSYEEPPISPVAGPSHQDSSSSMMMYMETSSIAGPSNYQLDKQSQPHQQSQPQADTNACVLAWLPNGQCDDGSSPEIFIEEDNLCIVCYANEKRELTDYYCLLCKVRVCQKCFDGHRMLTNQLLKEHTNVGIEIIEWQAKTMAEKRNLMDFEELSLEPKACSSICTLAWMPNGMYEDESSLEITAKEDNFCSICYTNQKRKATEYFCLSCKIRICKECFDNHRKAPRQLQEPANAEVGIMNNHAEMPGTESLTILEEPPSLEPTAQPSVCTLAQLPNGKSNVGSSLEISIKEKNLCSVCYAKKNRKLTEYYCLLCKVRICQECFEDHKMLTHQLQKPKRVHVTFMRYHAKKMSGKQEKHSKICILSKMPKKRSKFQRWIRRATICSVCSVPEKKMKTIYHCTSCKVGVCQTCFDYHQKITHQRLGLKGIEVCIEKMRETRTLKAREKEEPECLKPIKHSKVCVLLKIPRRFSRISNRWVQPEKRCSICSNPQKVKRTTFLCASCDVGVCQKCFEYHQKLTHQTLGPKSKEICIKKPLETQSLMTHKEEEPDYLNLTNNSRKCELGRLPFVKSTTSTTKRRQVTQCSVCSSEELRKRTVFYCKLCEVGVCSNCFDKHRICIKEKGKTPHFQFNRSCLLGKLPKLPSSKSSKMIQREKPCTVCSTRTKKKRTVYYCMPCNVGVCKECFNGHCERTATSKKRFRLSALRYR